MLTHQSSALWVRKARRLAHCDRPAAARPGVSGALWTGLTTSFSGTLNSVVVRVLERTQSPANRSRNNRKLSVTQDALTSLTQTQHGGGLAEGVQPSDFEVFNFIFLIQVILK